MTQRNPEIDLLKGIHSIPEKYSKYSKCLDKIFQHFTIEKIKENARKRITTVDFSSFHQAVEEIESKKTVAVELESIDRYVERDPKKKLPNIQQMLTGTEVKLKLVGLNHEAKYAKIKEDQRRDILRNYQEVKYRKIMKKRQELRNLDHPAPGNYNPNYRAIRKKIPSVIIKNPSDSFRLAHRRVQVNSDYGNNSSIKLTQASNISLTESNNTSQNLLTCIPTSSTSPSHAGPNFKFENSSTRKGFVNDRKRNNVLTYLNPTSYGDYSYQTTERSSSVIRLKGFKINKMLGRTEVEPRNFPTAMAYNPKYSYTQPQKPANVMFDKKESRKIRKHIVLSKIIHSYKVSEDFHVGRLLELPEKRK